MIKQTNCALKVSEQVKQFYTEYSFPFTENASLEALKEKLQWISKTLPDSLKGKEVLDLGCGTGLISCALALEAKKVVGIDFSAASIEKAKKLAKKFKLKNISFEEGDLFNLRIKKQFDNVFCIGVLHHTQDAYEGFFSLVPKVEGGGYVTLGLYNLHTNISYLVLQKMLNAFIPNPKLRIRFVSKIFPNRDSIRLADMYANPHKTFHTISQVKKWFKDNDFEFVGSESLKGFFMISGKKI